MSAGTWYQYGPSGMTSSGARSSSNNGASLSISSETTACMYVS